MLAFTNLFFLGSVLLAQLGSIDTWSPVSVAMMIWVIGQVAVNCIQVVKGQQPQQSAASLAQFQTLMAAFQNHDTQLTNLATNQLPPQVQAQLLQSVNLIAAKTGIPLPVGVITATAKQQAVMVPPSATK